MLEMGKLQLFIMIYIYIYIYSGSDLKYMYMYVVQYAATSCQSLPDNKRMHNDI